jgi:hypothetical protein
MQKKKKKKNDITWYYYHHITKFPSPTTVFYCFELYSIDAHLYFHIIWNNIIQIGNHKFMTFTKALDIEYILPSHPSLVCPKQSPFNNHVHIIIIISLDPAYEQNT